MIPEEVLADNPAILEKIVELSARRICRLCLGDVDSLVEIDVVWKMKIVSCFPMVTVGSARLPKYICEPCGKFVKKCYEFRQLCRKAEQMLVNYPLTGTWSGELPIPRWLREEDQQEQAGTARKRKFAGDLVSSQVGSVRVRSHVSMAMSLQSPTITPGVMEQIDERSQESQIDSQLEQPTITPTTHQPHYKVPVIQSASQPVSSQHSTQLRNPGTNITPVSQPPQKIQRTNSIPSLPQLILHPGYTMQQQTPQLVSRPQIQSSNANLNNMVQMLSQLTSLPQPAVQQQIPTNYTQSNFLLTTPGYRQPQYTSIQQSSIVMTPTRTQNLSTFQNNQLPQIVMTPTQNPQMTPTYQQPQIPMTPTRTQYPSMFQNNQLPQIAMTPTRVQNPQMTPTYQQSQIATTPTVTQNLPTLQHLLQTSTAKTPTRPSTTPNNKQPTGIWCHVCDFQFLTVEHYKFHLRKHNPNPIGDLTSGLRPQLKTCRLCTAKAFPTHADLLHHMRAHESVGLSKACDFCVKIFADERHRSEHFRKHHGDVLERTLKLNGQ